MITRREWLGGSVATGAAALLPAGCATAPRGVEGGVEVNDVHSQLNPTRVARVERPTSVEGVQRAMEAARAEGFPISAAGGRHAMGGQQFGRGAVLLDMRGMNRALRLDPESGQLLVEGGIEWPELIAYTVSGQAGRSRPWGIAQKQTGADRLTIGGALSANVHGRGLAMPPDRPGRGVVHAGGRERRAGPLQPRARTRAVPPRHRRLRPVRRHHLVTLRLVPRRKLERVVEVRTRTG